MDELWQRYKGFWTPVLWGVGIFLAGLIVVHMMTADPELGQKANDDAVKRIKDRIAPQAKQIQALRDSTGVLQKRMDDWAKRLDQRHGDDADVLTAAVSQMLKAAICRGHFPADPAAFDGDESAASQATALYEARLKEHLSLLKSQDPNVSFSRLRADVTGELSVRANRADVDVAADEFGMSAVTSVDRADLPRRLLNLALIATVVDVAIREGIRSLDAVTILPSEVRELNQGPEPFLQEWPVKIDMTATPDALTEILNVLTDPARPTALGYVSWRQTGKKDGFVKAEIKAYSLRVRPETPLGLETEEGQ